MGDQKAIGRLSAVAAMAALLGAGAGAARPEGPTLSVPGGYGKAGRRVKLRQRRAAHALARRARRQMAAASRRRNR